MTLKLIRTFLAIELKNESTINNLLDFCNRLKQNQPQIKLVEAENLHLTIKFIGNIPEQQAPKIYAILMEEINKMYFPDKNYNYTLKGVGQFRKFSVIWIKVLGNIQIIQDAKNKLEELLYTQLEIKKDNRSEFQPHLTIGRLKKEKINYKNLNSLKNLIETYKNKEFGPFTITGIKLKKSQLTPKGPIYTDLNY